MTHFHVLSAKGLDVVLASTVYNNYEDSLNAYVGLSNLAFAHIFGADMLSRENAIAATGGGLGDGAYCGTEEWTFVWMRCEELPCGSVTWN